MFIMIGGSELVSTLLYKYMPILLQWILQEKIISLTSDHIKAIICKCWWFGEVLEE